MMTLRPQLLLATMALTWGTHALAFDLSIEDFDQESLAVIKQAKTSSDISVLNEAANILIYDSMMQENVDQGVVYLSKAAGLGDEESQVELADYYYSEDDYVNALKWYHQAEGHKDPYVLYSLGVMYFDGEGTEPDYQKANQYYEQAANAGYADAMYQLAFSYNDGKGVKQDYQKAAYWFQKAADEGDESAMYNLGISYLNGEGVGKDCKKAMELFNQAIESNDHALSYAKLGDIYSYTEYKAPCGLEKSDYKKALGYYKSAALEGDSYSQFQVGYAYRNGHGDWSNFVKALAWFQIALEYGYDDAQSAIDEVKNQMSDQDIEKANKLQEAIENEF
ncbi:hypothetical protein SAMN04488136_1413 [Vibrio xiamenensis]|uniref:TPR repeat n=2 Tax=Vibrio xiamenensis TaxID=861298 RepID=A0A1G8GUI1_9VIBR|nr:tetratricopeptide repeat protein [Vibrio xiamenensis]SDH97999.1 hypothetical protein SAMN04488136_1413 [Vibrio xiamenensis]